MGASQSPKYSGVCKLLSDACFSAAVPFLRGKREGRKTGLHLTRDLQRGAPARYDCFQTWIREPHYFGRMLARFSLLDSTLLRKGVRNVN
jgi:hypothetical protein